MHRILIILAAVLLSCASAVSSQAQTPARGIQAVQPPPEAQNYQFSFAALRQIQCERPSNASAAAPACEAAGAPYCPQEIDWVVPGRALDQVCQVSCTIVRAAPNRFGPSQQQQARCSCRLNTSDCR